jgi:DNA-binding NtrC family response regulator
VTEVGHQFMGAAQSLGPENAPLPASVLLVEDEVLIRVALADALREAGYVVVETANADEAIHVLRATDGIQLMISDIQMAGSMDGVSLARLIHSNRPAIKIIFISGHMATIDDVKHEGVFRKPFDFSRLIAHIKTIVN